MTYNANDFFAELAARRTPCEFCGKPLPGESARHGHKMHRHCRAESDSRARYAASASADPLNVAMDAWPGGEPRTDWTASVGRVCWRESLRMSA
jgi:hypothetical protein